MSFEKKGIVELNPLFRKDDGYPNMLRFGIIKVVGTVIVIILIFTVQQLYIPIILTTVQGFITLRNIYIIKKYGKN